MGKRTLLALLAILTGLPLLAQQISEDEARAVAARFWQNGTAMGVRSDVQAQPQLAYTSRRSGKSCFYVFNRGTDGGFVIVGADGAAEEILGYSDNGTFDPDRIPDNLRWWLGEYEAQIAEAIGLGVTAETRSQLRRSLSKAGKKTIPYMVQTSWNQYAPYSDMCPMVNGYRCLTGCVATAMAQVMNFHQWPKQGEGSHSFTHEGITIEADFGSTEYDWDNMMDDYTGAETAAQKRAVAELMYHCGVGVEMMYGTASSGAYDLNVPKALTTYFGYDKGMTMPYRNYYTNTEWENLVYEELAAGRPLYYSGATDEPAGHAFVCDGYNASSNFFHINWGWGGYCDGYYSLSGSSALSPGGSGAGGGGVGKGYIYNQLVVAGIQPDAGGTARGEVGVMGCEIALLKWDGAGSWQTFDIAEAGDMIGVSANMQNISIVDVSFTCGLKLTDPDTKEVFYAEGVSELGSLPPTYYYTMYEQKNAFQVTLPTSKLTRLVPYEVEYVYKLSGESEWRPLRFSTTCGEVSEELTINKNAPIEVLECGFPDNEAVPMGEYGLQLSVKNVGKSKYLNSIFIRVYEADGDGEAAYVGCFSKSTGGIAIGETKDFLLTPENFYPVDGAALEAGKRYFMRYIDQSNSINAVLATCYFTPKDIPAYHLTYMVDGEVYLTVPMGEGSAVTPAKAPAEREGYTFSGWEGLPETMPAEDVTVTGTFTVNTYTLTYYLDGEVYRTETVEYGATIVPPVVEDTDEYVFAGWQDVPETMPARDVDIHGTTQPTGIDMLEAGTRVDVYSLQGVLVRRGIAVERLRTELPAGLYIVDGRKVWIR